MVEQLSMFPLTLKVVTKKRVTVYAAPSGFMQISTRALYYTESGATQLIIIWSKLHAWQSKS